MSTTASVRKQLHVLARERGIDPKWRDQDGVTHVCADDTLLNALRLLGVDVKRPEDARSARREMAAARALQLVDCVAVAWDGAQPVLKMCLPAASAGARFAVTVEEDEGGIVRCAREACDVRMTGATEEIVELEVRLARGCTAFGRHRFRVEVDGRRTRGEGWILAAPSRVGRAGLDHAWGVFAPVYAMHDRDRTHTGDLGSLARLAEWAGGRGARVVATLPLLATFVGHGGEPRDPSPYVPASRRFWNECYVDLGAVPELEGNDAVVVEPSPGEYVDLPRLAAARRPWLERACAGLDRLPARRAEHDRWLEANPLAREYAAFRAQQEGTGAAGSHLHTYAQWLCAQQLTDLSARVGARGQALYFDFPVGTHRDGFDVAAEGDLFLRGATVGAPPDKFFAGGQDWGFPPINPVLARASGYAYLSSCLRAHFAYARALRIDHVMGLHRLWVIASGATATEGTYVHYTAEEQWAIVCIEAARANATVVGENLGTVPPEADRALRRRRGLGMWVLQFEADSAPTSNELASIGTHDLPTFATWWAALAPAPCDTLLRTLRDAGELAGDGEAPAPEAVQHAILAWLGRSRAPIVLASLEDLWLETEPQNVPGTADPYAFRRRWAHGLDDLDNLDTVKQGLERLDGGRQRRTRDRRHGS